MPGTLSWPLGFCECQRCMSRVQAVRDLTHEELHHSRGSCLPSCPGGAISRRQLPLLLPRHLRIMWGLQPRVWRTSRKRRLWTSRSL